MGSGIRILQRQRNFKRFYVNRRVERREFRFDLDISYLNFLQFGIFFFGINKEVKNEELC